MMIDYLKRKKYWLIIFVTINLSFFLYEECNKALAINSRDKIVTKKMSSMEELIKEKSINATKVNTLKLELKKQEKNFFVNTNETELITLFKNFFDDTSYNLTYLNVVKQESVPEICEFLITITYKSTFNDALNFLSSLRQYDRSFYIKSMKLTNNGSNLIESKLEIYTYSLKDNNTLAMVKPIIMHPIDYTKNLFYEDSTFTDKNDILKNNLEKPLSGIIDYINLKEYNPNLLITSNNSSGSLYISDNLLLDIKILNCFREDFIIFFNNYIPVFKPISSLSINDFNFPKDCEIKLIIRESDKSEYLIDGDKTDKIYTFDLSSIKNKFIIKGIKMIFNGPLERQITIDSKFEIKEL